MAGREEFVLVFSVCSTLYRKVRAFYMLSLLCGLMKVLYTRRLVEKTELTPGLFGDPLLLSNAN